MNIEINAGLLIAIIAVTVIAGVATGYITAMQDEEERR